MNWLEKQWGQRNLWSALLLLPLSWLFGCIVALRRLAYRTALCRSQRLPVPVIVVGNISVGGTGKTPLVLWLVERLREHGYKPGIISRGYGGKAQRPQGVAATSDPFLLGDEPVLLARRARCPVWVGRDRVAAGRALLAAHQDCDVIISDDGLQHYALQRDVEIAVVDAQRGFGNGWLLPAGPLREPPSRLLEVDAIVSNGDNGKNMPHRYTMRLCGEIFRNLADASRTVKAGHFAGQHLHAVAGIGHPQRFFQQLRQMGLAVEAHAFPDHHPFRLEDLQIHGADAILMTEKDAVKCAAFLQPRWWYLEVTAEMDTALVDRILEKMGKRDGRQTA
jgi:tetraacyldisaccharide 4'-kinase